MRQKSATQAGGVGKVKELWDWGGWAIYDDLGVWRVFVEEVAATNSMD